MSSATTATTLLNARTPDDPYPIQGLLFCARCSQPFFGTWLPGGTRAYRSRCGCWLRPLDAGQVERRVCAEAQRFALGHVIASGGHVCEFAVRLFARVSLGATADDINFTRRTQKWSRP
jgi:hypothetical protein